MDAHTEEAIHLRGHILQSIGNKIDVISAFSGRKHEVVVVAAKPTLDCGDSHSIVCRFPGTVTNTSEIPHIPIIYCSAARIIDSIDPHRIGTGSIGDDIASKMNQVHERRLCGT